MSDERSLHDRLDRPAPGEQQAEERAWPVVRAAFETRESEPPRRRKPSGPSVGLGLAAMLAVLAVTPVGSAVADWIRDTGERIVGFSDPDPRRVELPAPGRLLVNTSHGPWVLDEDGSRRRLGDLREASWSPGGLYVAATDAEGRRVVAVTPAGKVRWTVEPPLPPHPVRGDPDRMPVDDPRWAPSGLRVAYLAGRTLRVLDGDGTDDAEVAEAVEPVPPAWQPRSDANVVSYVAGGEVVTTNADSRNVLWRAGVNDAVAQLVWSADGQRLAAVSARRLRVFDPNGKLVWKRPLPTAFPIAAPGEVAEVAFEPAGDRLALTLDVRDGESNAVIVIDGRRGVGHKDAIVYRGAGALGGVTWSPDGEWLLVDADAALEWTFVELNGRERQKTVADTGGLFGPPPDPSSVSGWCCPLR